MKLLEHFEKQFKDGRMKENDNVAITFELERALKNSESLKAAPDLLQNGYIKKVLTAWTRKWQANANGVVIESSG